MAEGAPRRIVLVGFMAAGKTRLGRLLAERIGWRHVDLDAEVEHRAGCSIAEIFRAEGEAGFRAREAAATDTVAGADRLVVSTGGGWAAQRGLWERLAPGTFFVWLYASPAELLVRARAGGSRRPLLAPGTPAERVAELLREREPFYRRADIHISNEGRRASETVSELVRVLAERGIIPPRPALSKTQS